MAKTLIAVVLIIASIYLLGFIGSLVINYNSSKEVNYPSNSSPFPSPSSNPRPEIKIKDISSSKKRLEISEYQLGVTIPSNWQHELSDQSKVYIYKEGEEKRYEGYMIIKSPSKNIISIIPNLQGGWCEGPNEPKKEILPVRFGLPATKFTCGTSYYLYGDLDKPGPVIPNLFVSVDDDSDPEVKNIISSISYIPTK